MQPGETLLIIPTLHTERESSDFMTDGGDLSQSNERFYLPKDNTGMGGSSGHEMVFFISIQLNVVLLAPVQVLSGSLYWLPPTFQKHVRIIGEDGWMDG